MGIKRLQTEVLAHDHFIKVVRQVVVLTELDTSRVRMSGREQNRRVNKGDLVAHHSRLNGVDVLAAVGDLDAEGWVAHGLTNNACARICQMVFSPYAQLIERLNVRTRFAPAIAPDLVEISTQ